MMMFEENREDELESRKVFPVVGFVGFVGLEEGFRIESTFLKINFSGSVSGEEGPPRSSSEATESGKMLTV